MNLVGNGIGASLQIDIASGMTIKTSRVAGVEHGLHGLDHRARTLRHWLRTLNRLDTLNRLNTRTLGGGARVKRQIPVDNFASASLLGQQNATIGVQVASTERFKLTRLLFLRLLLRLLRSATSDNSDATVRQVDATVDRFSGHGGGRGDRCRCHRCHRCHRCFG